MLTVDTKVGNDSLATGVFETPSVSNVPGLLLNIIDSSKVYDQAYKNAFPEQLVAALVQLENAACALVYYLDGLCVFGAAGGGHVWVLPDTGSMRDLPITKHNTGRVDVLVWSMDTKQTGKNATIIAATRSATIDPSFPQNAMVSLYNTVCKVHKPTGAVKFSTKEGELEEADNTRVYQLTRGEAVRSVRMQNPNRSVWAKKDLRPPM